jgi:hypothetical protein
VANVLKFELVGYRDVKGRFARASDELRRAKRDEMRALGRTTVDTLQYYAPKDSGKFAEGIKYRTDESGNRTTLTLYVGGEHAFLLDIITGGSRDHPIYPRGNYPLRFFWPRGPEGPKVYYYMSVQHPGTIPNPFVERAMDALSPQFEMALSRVGASLRFL